MAIKNAVTIDEVISILNRALKSDPKAMCDVFLHRVACNDALADDPTIQVGEYEGFPGTSIGPLGLINGFFGMDEETGFGAIAAIFNYWMDGTIELKRFKKGEPASLSLKAKIDNNEIHRDDTCDDPNAGKQLVYQLVAGVEQHARTEDSGELEHQADDGVCRVCGCTDDHACPGGCFWVEPDLCSRCDETIDNIVDLGLAGAGILEAIARWKIRNRAKLERQVDVGARVGEDLDDSDVIAGGELPPDDNRNFFSPSEIEELGRENPTGPEYRIETDAEKNARAEIVQCENLRPRHWMPRQDDRVHYHSIIGGPVTSTGHVVKAVSTLASGEPVAWITGKVGCVSCDALTQAPLEGIDRDKVHVDFSLSCEPGCDGESPHPDGCDKVDDEENRAPVQGVTSYGGVKNSDIKPA
jgi:hypothetical protein